MNTVSVDNPKIWVQYMNNKDCSQGFCSLYCPQWCYILFPPPPPFQQLSNNPPSPNFSPLVITIIGILSGAFLLVSYYAIISKYCGNRSLSFTRHELNNNHDSSDVEMGDNYNHDHEAGPHEPWFVNTNGLDQSLIMSIPMFKYKRGDGLIEGSDCSVCLSEFDEDESLRVLPKCGHAFHMPCIDTWLECHSNCPLCRANVVSVVESLPPREDESLLERSIGDVDNNVTDVGEGIVEIDRSNQEMEGINVAKTPSRELIDLGSRETSIDETIRRSMSMDCIFGPRLSMADVLHVIDHDEDYESEEANRHHYNRNMELNIVMKRSHSGGRWWFSKCGRYQNVVLPF